MTSLDHPGVSTRRIVLIDFGWQDADHLPSLLRTPGVSIRLVCGISPDDAGVRLAALCGLPRSVELADLTREIFDVALVGSASPRREQLERLLRALGTAVDSPQRFVRNGHHEDRRDPARDPSADVTAATADVFTDDWVPEGLAVPVGVDETADRPPQRLPAPDDTLDLQRCLANWVADSAASAASLHLGSADQLTRLCRVGPDDPLMEALVALAFRLDTPHVLRREDGVQRGRLWAAWPFHTEHRRGVVAMAGGDGEIARGIWEPAVQALCVSWSVAEHGDLPDPPGLTLLDPPVFTQRLQLAVERHRTERFKFGLYRLTFEGDEAVVTAMLDDLPNRLRGTDCVCRPAPDELLLLCAGSAQAFQQVRRRISLLWRLAWNAHWGPGHAPPIHDERIELAGVPGSGVTHDFLASSQDRMGGESPR